VTSRRSDSSTSRSTATASTTRSPDRNSRPASSYSDLRILKVPNMTSYDVTLKHWRALDAEINKRNPQMLP